MIQQLNLRSFRGIKDRSYAFGPKKNLIQGPNEAGKTTIAHGLAFACYGVDALGTKNPDHLISHGEDSCEVAMVTSKATFIRKKKRGASSVVKIVRDGLPEIKMTQTELTALLGMEFDLFASCAFAGYFMGLSDVKKREVVSQAWRVDRAALLRELIGNLVVPDKLVKLENPRLDAANVARERQIKQNQMFGDDGALVQITMQLETLKSPEGAVPSAEEINALRTELALADNYDRELRDYQQAVKIWDLREQENQGIEKQRTQLLTELGNLGGRPAAPNDEMRETLVALRAKANDACLQPVPVPAKPAAHNVKAGRCPTCQTVVGAEHAEAVKAAHDAVLIEYNQHERVVATENASRAESRAALAKEIDALTQRGQQMKLDVETWDYKIKSMKEAEARLKTKDNPKPVAPLAVKPSVGLKDRLLAIDASIAAAAFFESQAAVLREKQVSLETAVAAKRAEIADLATLENALNAMPDIEVERTAKQFVLHKAVVDFTDGEFVVEDDRGIPYVSLSSGRKIKMDLEFVKLFHKLTPSAPPFVFIDNADLVDSWDQFQLPDMQIMLAHVDSKLTELQIVSL